MRKYIALYFCLIFVISWSINFPAHSNNLLVKYSPSDLPNLIVAYNLAITHYEDFKCIWKLSGKDQYSHPFPMLKSKFNKISPKINISFGFTHTAFIVQNQMKGQLLGLSFVKEKDNKGLTIPFENILFVTTPIESFGNRCLIFLSSVSPECTYILAIDKEFGVELLYSTFDDNLNRIWEKQGYTIMCSIYSIQVIEPGVFILSERENNKCTINKEERRFQINVADGKFKILLGGRP